MTSEAPFGGGDFDSEMTMRIPRTSADGAAIAALMREGPSPLTTQMVPEPPTQPGKVRVTPQTFALPASALSDRASLTVIRGPSSGQIFTITTPEVVIGRDPRCDLAFDDAALSRQHARVVRRHDGRYIIEDLGSTNGTFVGGQPIVRTVLASDDRVHIGPNLVLQFSMTDEDEALLQRRLYEASTRDGLTGTYNRLVFEERLAVEMDHAHRSKTPISLLLLDFDHFKRVNDGPGGHLAGDAVLRAFAVQAHRMIRTADLFARLGGEEFGILAHATSSHDAAAMGERIRVAVEEMRVSVGDVNVGITVSIGVACSSECDAGATGADLVSMADTRLYAVKSSGRNRVLAEG